MPAARSVSEYFAPYAAVIVTGASSGIGEEFVRAISKLSPRARFFNLSRTPPKSPLEAGQIVHCPADLSTASGQESAALAAQNWLATAGGGGAILLINNSGFGSFGPFPGPGLDRCLEMIDLNARAPMVLTGRLLPLLLERGGAVINVASIAAFQPTPLMTVYGATKAFLLNWSLGLWQDLRETKVHVLCVCPGPTRTNFFRGAGFVDAPATGWLGQTSDAVVQESLRALASGKALVVTGWLNKLQVALSSRLPRALVAVLARRALAKDRPVPHSASAARDIIVTPTK